jgi:5-methylthioadenosine/S-adenosylhomocysteine deaminase
VTQPDLLIAGGRVYDHDGDIHQPPVCDVLVQGGRIASVTAPGDDAAAKAALRRQAGPGGPRVIDAAGLLVLPGFVNAHYHSYDVLQKGMLEDMPFDVWALHSQPAYLGPRSARELRLRTLIGAVDCLRHGITTVQDMNSLVPMDEPTLDTILAAYADSGLRVVFSAALRDVAALDIAPFLPADAPAAVRALVDGAPADPHAQLAFVEAQIRRLEPLPERLRWALSPSGPQRSSRTLLEGVADLSRRYGLPVLTHAYETRAQAAKARALYGEQGGSMLRYLAEVGLLNERLTIAHGVWLRDDEVALLGAAGAGLAHNPVSNLKLKSGVAPMRRVIDAGVNIALGCDNCSCGDSQSMFAAMKLLCLLAAAAEPNPTGVHAATALRAATLGGARAVGMGGEIGAIRPGMLADLVLLDTSDIAYVPFNSAARQVVYAEAGRGVHSVVVGGEVVLDARRLTTIDEAALLAEAAAVMPGFAADYAAQAARSQEAVPWLLEANRRVATAHEVGLDRFIPG